MSKMGNWIIDQGLADFWMKVDCANRWLEQSEKLASKIIKELEEDLEEEDINDVGVSQ